MIKYIIKSNELIKFYNFISKLLYVLNKQNVCNLGKLNSKFYYKINKEVDKLYIKRLLQKYQSFKLSNIRKGE